MFFRYLFHFPVFNLPVSILRRKPPADTASRRGSDNLFIWPPFVFQLCLASPIISLGRMSAKSHENLKAIRFGGELLPDWAQLLDLAARLCPVSEDVRRWFSRLTTCSGVDDARTVIHQCRLLRTSIQEHREAIAAELKRSREDSQPSQVLEAWMYALDTMIQEAQTSKTCSWIVEGTEDTEVDDSDGGDITLRRV
jgi:hypothetical protein